MKSVFVSALMFMISTQAAFAGHVVNLLYCRSKDSGPDHGLSLIIQTDLTLRNTFANLSSQSIAGPRPVATYDYLKIKDLRPVDGPVTYKNRDFSLSVSARPSREGHFPGTMSARTLGSNSTVIKKEMICNYTR